MSVSGLSSPQTTLFFYDCEVDHKDIDTVNVTEICVSENNPRDQGGKPYFVGYVEKSEHANYDGPYQKPIPATSERFKFSTILKKVESFIKKRTSGNSISALMGYNVEGWDQPVLERNCDRFGVSKEGVSKWKWIDLAKIAHYLGYPMGTTQQQLEVAIGATNLPFNRHRAHADVKVVKEIWRKMTATIFGDEAKEAELDKALGSENAEEVVADFLKKQDPSLIPTPEALEVIENVKKAEKLARKEIVVLYDLETTGLFPEMDKKKAGSHNVAPRIVDFAAKILSPFEGAEYENETFSSLVNPGMHIPIEATRVHHITDEMVQEAPSMKEVWGGFEAWVRTTNTFKRIMAENEGGKYEEPRIILVGYNNFRYDNPVLGGELLMAGVDLKREMDRSVKESWDSLPLMTTWYTGRPKEEKPVDNKMQTHARFLGIPENEAHRALPDVEVLEQILRKVTAPINPVHVIVGAVKEKINLMSPGVGLKEIIRETQERVKNQEDELEAVKHSIQSYLDRKQAEKAEKAEEVERPAKRQKKEEKKQREPVTQELTVPSQDLDAISYI